MGRKESVMSMHDEQAPHPPLPTTPTATRSAERSSVDETTSKPAPCQAPFDSYAEPAEPRPSVLLQANEALRAEIAKRRQAEEEKSRLLAAVSQQRTELHALATRLAEVQEIERQQLARELHDQV